jgi:hypothetical protein
MDFECNRGFYANNQPLHPLSIIALYDRRVEPRGQSGIDRNKVKVRDSARLLYDLPKCSASGGQLLYWGRVPAWFSSGAGVGAGGPRLPPTGVHLARSVPAEDRHNLPSP